MRRYTFEFKGEVNIQILDKGHAFANFAQMFRGVVVVLHSSKVYREYEHILFGDLKVFELVV